MEPHMSTMNCLTEHSCILSPTKPERKVSSDRFGLQQALASDVLVLSHTPRKPGRKASGELAQTTGTFNEGQPDTKEESATPLPRPKSYSLPSVKTLPLPSRVPPKRSSTSQGGTPIPNSNKESIGHFSPREEREHCRLSRSLNDVLLSSELSSEFSQEMLKSPPRRPRRQWELPEKRGSMNDSLFASPSCCQLTPNGTLVDSPPRQPVRINATSPTTV